MISHTTFKAVIFGSSSTIQLTLHHGMVLLHLDDTNIAISKTGSFLSTVMM